MKNAFLRIEKLAAGQVQGYEQWQRIPLSTRAILIGRPTDEPGAAELDVKIVGDDYISRSPVQISYSPVDDSYSLSDHGTRNGTFLNGELLETDGRPYRLRDYDVIGLAKVRGETRVLLRFRTSHKTQPGWVVETPHQTPRKDGIAVNLSARKVYVNGSRVSLTKTEWKILELLYIHRGRVCTLDEIAWEVWGSDGASPELIAKYIQRLRDKVEPDRSNVRYIITDSTGGYVLELDEV